MTLNMTCQNQPNNSLKCSLNNQWALKGKYKNETRPHNNDIKMNHQIPKNQEINGVNESPYFHWCLYQWNRCKHAINASIFFLFNIGRLSYVKDQVVILYQYFKLTLSALWYIEYISFSFYTTQTNHLHIYIVDGISM